MSTAPISLYFDVPKGQHADLEVVARAAIEWVELIRSLASVVAPNLEFDVELVETEDGSLWLSNLLKAAKEGDRKALAALAYAVLIFFAAGPALHVQADAGDKFWEMLGHEHHVTLTIEEKEDIAQRVVEAFAVPAAQERRRNIIIETGKDETIHGVGVGLAPSKSGPICKIPRSEFASYVLNVDKKRPALQKTTELQSNVRVKIARANLEEGDEKPRWRFKEGETKWSADIEDEEFVLALNLEQTGLPLAVGQAMVVDVAIDRKLVDGAWEEANRRIIRVVKPEVSRRQGNLSLGRE